jgi:Amino acid permease N-terminal
MSTGYDTKYAKSFRHFTREALPRLDNYRNIMSIQAAYRPTLDELHNATVHGKVGARRFHSCIFSRKQMAFSRLDRAAEELWARH